MNDFLLNHHANFLQAQQEFPISEILFQAGMNYLAQRQ